MKTYALRFYFLVRILVFQCAVFPTTSLGTSLSTPTTPSVSSTPSIHDNGTEQQNYTFSTPYNSTNFTYPTLLDGDFNQSSTSSSTKDFTESGQSTVSVLAMANTGQSSSRIPVRNQTVNQSISSYSPSETSPSSSSATSHPTTLGVITDSTINDDSTHDQSNTTSQTTTRNGDSRSRTTDGNKSNSSHLTTTGVPSSKTKKGSKTKTISTLTNLTTSFVDVTALDSGVTEGIVTLSKAWTLDPTTIEESNDRGLQSVMKDLTASIHGLTITAGLLAGVITFAITAVVVVAVVKRFRRCGGCLACERGHTESGASQTPRDGHYFRPHSVFDFLGQRGSRDSRETSRDGDEASASHDQLAPGEEQERDHQTIPSRRTDAAVNAQQPIIIDDMVKGDKCTATHRMEGTIYPSL